MENKLRKIYLPIVVVLIITIAIVSASSYGYGGDGGGSSTCGQQGVVSGEKSDNIADYKIIEKDMVNGESMTYLFTSSEFSTQITFTGKKDQCSVMVRLEYLKGTSKLAKVDAPGNVFINENVWIGTQIQDNVSVRLGAKDSLISYSGIAPGDIGVFQYDVKGGSWKQLDTKIIDDNGSIYLEFSTTGTLIFAISGLKEGTGTLLKTSVVNPIPEETTKIPETTDTATTSGSAGTEKSPGFESIVAIIAFLSVIYIAKRK